MPILYSSTGSNLFGAFWGGGGDWNGTGEPECSPFVPQMECGLHYV